jgi:hypothetical protein
MLVTLLVVPGQRIEDTLKLRFRVKDQGQSMVS